MVSSDGRELGWTSGGLRIVFTPGTLYEYEPRQVVGPYRINSFGLRGGELADRPIRRRVVTGGSATFGLGVDEEATFVARLASRFPGDEFLNAGVIGYVSQQELALVLFKLSDLRPDVIIALNGWNDLYDRYWWEIFGHGPNTHPAASVQFGLIQNRLHELRRIEHEPGYALASSWRSIVRGSTTLTAIHGWAAPRPPSRMSSIEAAGLVTPAVESYLSHMEKLHDLARSLGSRLIVVVQPSLDQVLAPSTLARKSREGQDFADDDRYWVEFPAMYADFRARAVAGLRGRGIEVVDASARFGEHAEAAPAWFADVVHLSRTGHRQLARIIADALAER